MEKPLSKLSSASPLISLLLLSLEVAPISLLLHRIVIRLILWWCKDFQVSKSIGKFSVLILLDLLEVVYMSQWLLPSHWNIFFLSVQFSRSVVSDSLWPHEPQHTRSPCPLPTPGVHPNPCPLSWWCYPAISSSVVPFSSCPQSFFLWKSSIVPSQCPLMLSPHFPKSTCWHIPGLSPFLISYLLYLLPFPRWYHSISCFRYLNDHHLNFIFQFFSLPELQTEIPIWHFHLDV